MKKLNSSLVLGAALTALSGQAAAELRVVVTPTRTAQTENITPANIVVIDKQAIESSGAVDLAGILQGQAGIIVTESSTGPQVSMRGFTPGSAANNVLILIDGRRLNNPDIASPDLSSISLNRVAQIEVINGSAGVQYGDQAIGGVINIITTTESADTGSAQGSVTVGGGSYDRQLLRANVGYQITDELTVAVRGENLQTNNYRQHNAQDRTGGAVKLDYKNDKTTAYLELGYTDNNLQTPGNLTAAEVAAQRKLSRPEYAGDFIDTRTKTNSAGIKQSLTPDWNYYVDLSQRESEISSLQSFRGSASTSTTKIERSQSSLNPRLERTLQHLGRTGSVLVGLDFERGEFDMQSTRIVRSNVQTVNSAYVRAIVPAVSIVDFVAGVRRSTVEDDIKDKAVYPTGQRLKSANTAAEVGFNLQFNEAHKATVRWDENFRFAKVDEQAYTSPGVLGLKPQTGESIEVGYEYAGEKLAAYVNAYQLSLEDEIFFDSTAAKPIGGGFSGANVNADESVRKGLNAGFSFVISDLWAAGLNASVVDAERESGANEGKIIPFIPEASYRVFGQFKPLLDLSLTAEVVGVGSRYADGDVDNDSAKAEAYEVVNLAAQYRINEWSLGLRIDNLLDEKYSSYVKEGSLYGPAPTYTQTKTTFQAPAAERNFWVTAKYSF